MFLCLSDTEFLLIIYFTRIKFAEINTYGFGILCEFYRDNSNSTKERSTLSLLSKFPLVTIKEGYYRWV